MGPYVNVNGNKKTVTDIFANVNGQKKKIISGWVKRNNEVAKIYGVDDDRQIYVVTVSGSVPYYSYDLESWNQVKGITSDDINIMDICFACGKFICFDTNNYKVWYSENGKRFYEANISVSDSYKTIVSCDTFAILCNTNSNGDGNFYKTTDGINWTKYLPTDDSGNKFEFTYLQFFENKIYSLPTTYEDNVYISYDGGLTFTKTGELSYSNEQHNEGIVGRLNGNFIALVPSGRYTGYMYMFYSNDFVTFQDPLPLLKLYSSNKDNNNQVFNPTIIGEYIYCFGFRNNNSTDTGVYYNKGTTMPSTNKKFSNFSKLKIDNVEQNISSVSFINSKLFKIGNVFYKAFNEKLCYSNDYINWITLNTFSNKVYQIATNK